MTSTVTADLWWIRRDMRLADNPALLAALESGAAAPVFPWGDPLGRWSGRRIAHLARVLFSLREDAGGAVAVRRGSPADVLVAAARETGATAVHAQREYSPAGIREQEAVEAALAVSGVELRFVGSPYAVAPDRIRNGSGDPYKVFTPYWKAWTSHGWRAPAGDPDLDRLVALESDVSLDQYAAHGDSSDPLTSPVEFRESRWLAHLTDFVESGLADYPEDRDLLGVDGVSHLSAPLAFGQLHPRTILAALPQGEDASAAFARQLAWRDFHADVLFHHPDAQRWSLTPTHKDEAWLDDRDADESFLAWRTGRTGFPLVDAGMRELAETGTMHNRARMVVASFLVKDLLIPWQRGADYFRRALIDYDHAQNQLNWQWVAGTGRDAAPYFRIFNPTTQAKKFDPDRAYVQRWVAEVDTPAYPEPIVDHAHARERYLASALPKGERA